MSLSVLAQAALQAALNQQATKVIKPLYQIYLSMLHLGDMPMGTDMLTL